MGLEAEAVDGRTEVRRARILEATMVVVAERGFARASVNLVCTRARVSRGTFYTSFASMEECLLAVIDDGYWRALPLIAGALAREQSRRDGMRAALASLLAFGDREPLLARVWFVEAIAAGPWALEHRERRLATLTSMIAWHEPSREGGREVGGEAQTVGYPSTAAEAVLGIVQTHLLADRPEPLIGLLGSAMTVIAGIHAAGDAASVEVERCESLTRSLVGNFEHQPPPEGAASACPSGVLDNPRAHRARRCLQYLSEHPGASNREVASAIGISSQPQISSLLARLAADGLLQNRPGGSGRANSWTLTAHGECLLDERTNYTRRGAYEVTVKS